MRQPLLHRRHRLGVLPLRVARALRARLDRDRHDTRDRGRWRTTASPLVTTTFCRCAASGGCAEAADAASTQHECNQGSHTILNPRLYAVRVRRHFVAIRAAQHRHIVVDPRRRRGRFAGCRRRPARIARLAQPVVFSAVPVGHPFPDVAAHVVEPVGVRRIRAGRPRAALPLARRVGEDSWRATRRYRGPTDTSRPRRRRARPFPIRPRSAAAPGARSRQTTTDNRTSHPHIDTRTTGWLPWPGGGCIVIPDIRRGKLAKCRFAIAARDERQFAHAWRRVPGRADEPRVLFVRDGKTADEKLADEHAVDGPLVLFGVCRPHEEIAGRDARQIGRYRGAHRGARARGGHLARTIGVVRDSQYSATPDTILP